MDKVKSELMNRYLSNIALRQESAISNVFLDGEPFSNHISNSLLREAYYGKNPELIKCEKLLDKAIQSKDDSVEIKQVQAILQKMFNFKRLVLSTIPIVAAATLPITTYKFKYIFDRIEMKKTDTGIAFRDEDQVEAVILINMITMYASGVTGEELLAIILHEIGHSMRMILPSTQMVNAIAAVSFTAAIYPAIIFNLLGTPLTIAAQELTNIKDSILRMIHFKNREIEAAVQGAYRLIRSIIGHTRMLEGLWNLFKGKNRWINFKETIKRSVLGTLGFGVGLNALGIVTNLAGFITKILKYKEEVLADFIATSYGYGPQIASGIKKIEEYERDSHLDNSIFRLLRLPFNMLNVVLDPHPNNITRFKSVIINLENELKKIVDKEAYDEIQKDIKAAKIELDKYEQAISKKKLKNFDLIIFRKFMTKLIDGHDDVRGLFFGLTPDDLKMLDDLEKLPNPTVEPSTLQECHQIILEMGYMTKEKKEFAISLLCD